MELSRKGHPEGLRAHTGVRGLDDILGGGLPYNRLYLVQGEPGAGKTTIGLQFLLEGIRSGEPGLYISLSESKTELEDVARSHGWDLGALSIYDRAPDASAFQEDQTLFHTSEVELSEVMKRLLAEVERVAPARVVFDSLSELRLLAQNPLRYRKQILALKTFFAGRDCTVLLLDESPVAPEDSQLRTLAHGVIVLEQLSPLYGAERRRIRITKLRGVKYRGGFHDFNIETGGIVVFPRVRASDHHEPFAPGQASSDLPQLDSLLGGGPDWGTTMLLMGPAGGGKSALATQYAVAAARRGEKSALFTFDEGLGTLYGRSEGLGIPLRELVDAGTISVQQMDPAEMSPGEFGVHVREAVEAKNARVVVIDSLNGYINAMPEESFLMVQLHELFSYLRQRGVLTIVVVAQHGLLGPGDTPADVSYLADTILLLRIYESAGGLHKAISMVKKRSGAHEKTIRAFSMDSRGLHVGPILDTLHGILSGLPAATKPNPTAGQPDDTA